MKLNRKEVYDKYDGRCAYCGEKIEYKDMQIDHLVPLSSRGKFKLVNPNDISNLMPSCRVCNNWKSNYRLEDFRKSLEDQINILKRNSSNFRMACKYNLIKAVKDVSITFYFEYVEIMGDLDET